MRAVATAPGLLVDVGDMVIGLIHQLRCCDGLSFRQIVAELAGAIKAGRKYRDIEPPKPPSQPAP
jgi:hypothetical protein